ncbi:MAG: lipoyl(octanoyl) transferase LipB [Planctomycetota bacterium]
MGTPSSDLTIETIDLGRMAYADAYAAQIEHHARVLAARAQGDTPAGVILTVEHDPVITVSKRPGAGENVLASQALLAAHGVALERTDRGGDVTYHGPGQLVVYPIFDLQRMGVRLHDHLRLLEQAVIDTIAGFGVVGRRDDNATGVWVDRDRLPEAKLCAIGVRVRKWVSLHGLALNVSPDLDHFGLIVPCGLHGRAVTSLSAVLGTGSPTVADVRTALTDRLERLYLDHAAASAV